jgi:hypothetical protein
MGKTKTIFYHFQDVGGTVNLSFVVTRIWKKLQTTSANAGILGKHKNCLKLLGDYKGNPGKLPPLLGHGRKSCCH